MTTMQERLRFATRDIQEAEGLVFDGEFPGAELLAGTDSGAATLGSCVVRLEFSIGGDSILMEGTVDGAWTLPCSRCLKPHEAALRAEVTETFAATLETIEAAEDLRQALVLVQPDRSLCREDCRGLCPLCGKDLNAGTCGCAPEATPPAVRDLRKKS